MIPPWQYIAWTAESTEGGSRDKRCIDLLSVRHSPVAFRVYRPWDHGVHQNVPRSKFGCEAPGDDVDSALTGAIDRRAGRRLGRRDGTNIDNGAALLAPGAGGCLRGEQQTFDVQIEHAIEMRFGNLWQGKKIIHTSVINQDIDPAEFGNRRVHQLSGFGWFTDVGTNTSSPRQAEELVAHIKSVVRWPLRFPLMRR